MALNVKEMTMPQIEAAMMERSAFNDNVFASEPDDAKIPDALKSRVADNNRELDELIVRAKELKAVAGDRQKSGEVKSWLNQSAGGVRHGNAVAGEVLSGDAANAAFRGEGGRSLADGFLGNEAFKSWSSATIPTGHKVSDKVKIQSPMIDMPDLTLKTLVTSNTTDVGRYTNTTGGALVRPQYLDMVALPFRPLKLREVVTVIRATSPLIEYPQITGYTNSAAEVAEATNTSSGTKPESALALALRTAQAATVAHYMPITRQALSDAPQLRDMIDTFLVNGLNQRLEDEMVAGDGTGANLTGITNISGVSQQAFVSNNLTTLRKAITKAQKSPIFVEPNAYILSPDDAEGLDLSTDNEARFYYGGPSQSGTPRLWNKPVIVSQAVPAGTVFTGDLKTLVLADLQEAVMYLTDTHSDWFVKNILALLAELRVLFFALRPAAVVQVTLGSW